jgi:glutamyl-Q tRNA(Asp) synthetase
MTPVSSSAAPYKGRFAPSPTGPLHAGSLVAAMASYLDARAHHGQWLIRIEDIDETRTVPGSAESILQTLAAFGMRSDVEVVWQSRRKFLYQNACEQLGHLAYPCGCTRREIADSRIGIASDGASVYPGICRTGLGHGKTARTIRLRVPDEARAEITFHDRFIGQVTQNLATEAGDFVLKRADGFWAYQLAVVVDDAAQHITHVVRGADLLDSTPRQIYLQQLLSLPTPHYLHVPLVSNQNGEKLSKQTGAQTLDITQTQQALHGELISSARFLGLLLHHSTSMADFWQQAITAWSEKYLMFRKGP